MNSIKSLIYLAARDCGDKAVGEMVGNGGISCMEILEKQGNNRGKSWDVM